MAEGSQAGHAREMAALAARDEQIDDLLVTAHHLVDDLKATVTAASEILRHPDGGIDEQRS